MSILSAMKTYIGTCPFLDEIAKEDIHIDLMNDEITNYGLSQTGDQLIKSYITGAQIRQANFGLYIKEYTYDDVKRLENSAFCERFIFWLETNPLTGVLPLLDDGFTSEKISSENAMLFDISESGDSGTYQIQINLTYRRV